MLKQIIVVLFIGVFNICYTQNAFIPEPTLKVISDFENLLTNDEIENIAVEIKKEYNANSNQIMIVCIPTSYLGDLTIEDYSQKLFEKWQPGQKGLDNGVLIVIAGSNIDTKGRKLRIHTGYGLEGALPDLICAKIEREIMVPELKNGNYYKAIKNGCLSILNLISKENIGNKPLNKIKIESTNNRVYDYAQIFTNEQIQTLENNLKKFLNKKGSVVITKLDNSSFSNSVIIQKRYNSKFDTTLLLINCNPGYYVDSKDSLLKFDQTKKTYEIVYYTHYSKYHSYLNTQLYEETDKLSLKLATIGLIETSTFLINQEYEGFQSNFKFMLYTILILVGLCILLFIIYKITKPANQNNIVNNKITFTKIILGILLSLSNTYAYLSLITFEMVYIALIDSYLEFSSTYLTIIWIFLATTQIIGIVLVDKINKNYFNSKLFNWLPQGSGGGSGNSKNSSSRSSSSSSSSSSRSSSSSSSNSGYSGGGGRSGGGGASSSW
jgi:uncharacterized membrane protein YgcG